MFDLIDISLLMIDNFLLFVMYKKLAKRFYFDLIYLGSNHLTNSLPFFCTVK